MTFFADFRSSAKELKNLRCLCVTAILIALDIAIKGLTIATPMGKISFSFLALAAIGMLYGPVVGAIAGFVTDILGMLVANNMGAFNPLYTLSEVAAGLIYGIFLYNFTVIKPDFSSSKMFFKTLAANWVSLLRMVLAKLAVIVFCNLLLTPFAHMVTGFWNWDTFWLKWNASALKSLIKAPIDLGLMLLTLYPIKAAYNAVFNRKTPRNTIKKSESKRVKSEE